MAGVGGVMKRETRLHKEDALRPKQEIAQEFIDELAQILNPLGDDAHGIVDLFRRAASLEKLAEAYCNDCGKPVKVRYPDYKGAAALLNILFDRVLGKPVQKIEETKEITGRVELVALKEASADELRAIVAESRRLEPGS